MVRTFLALIFTSICLNALAGWEIVTKYYGSSENPKNARSEYVYISTGYMKIVSGDITTVFNLEKQEILYLNTKSKRFWQGNTVRFNEDIREELRRKIDETLQNSDLKQQESQKQMYEEMLRNTFTDESTTIAPAKNFTVKKIKADQTIAGQKTIGYQVYDEVMPLETIWVAPQLKISSEFDFRDFSNLLQKLVKGAYSLSFESSNHYFKILDEGYPLKVEMHLNNGQKSISEVVKVTKMVLGKINFSVPQGYTSGSLTDVGVWDAYQ